MLTDKDIKKLIKAQKQIFPTADMIKRGFDGVDKRFEKVDKRFEQVDKRFDGLEKRFDKLEQEHEMLNLRLGEFAYRFEVEDPKKRLEKVEAKLAIK